MLAKTTIYLLTLTRKTGADNQTCLFSRSPGLNLETASTRSLGHPGGNVVCHQNPECRVGEKQAQLHRQQWGKHHAITQDLRRHGYGGRWASDCATARRRGGRARNG